MSALQGFIFIAGLIVLVGIYAHWRWTQSRKARADEDHERLEPAWEDEETWEDTAPAQDADEDWTAAPGEEAGPPPAAMAPAPQVSARVFRELHLEAGDRGIFYRYAEDGRQSVFCVANALEPGNFDLAELDGLRTPGLTVFAVLPGPWSARHILTAMHRAALTLADRLDGEVLDGRRAPLTAMSYQTLLDELPAEA